MIWNIVFDIKRFIHKNKNHQFRKDERAETLENLYTNLLKNVFSKNSQEILLWISAKILKFSSMAKIIISNRILRTDTFTGRNFHDFSDFWLFL